VCFDEANSFSSGLHSATVGSALPDGCKHGHLCAEEELGCGSQRNVGLDSCVVGECSHPRARDPERVSVDSSCGVIPDLCVSDPALVLTDVFSASPGIETRSSDPLAQSEKSVGDLADRLGVDSVESLHL